MLRVVDTENTAGQLLLEIRPVTGRRRECELEEVEATTAAAGRFEKVEVDEKDRGEAGDRRVKEWRRVTEVGRRDAIIIIMIIYSEGRDVAR